MPHEVELKFLLVPESVEKIQQFFEPMVTAPPRPLHLVNRYFDTADLRLQAKKVALRIRQKNDQFLQTFKTKGESSGGLHKRLEWEWPITGFALDQQLLESTGHFPEDIPISSLVPLFETNFNRLAYDISIDGVLFEVALDVGEAIAGSHAKPINELELELRQEATPEAIRALFGLAAKVAETVSVFPSDVSKGERGYYVAGCYPLDDITSAPVDTLQEVFRRWVQAQDYYELTGERTYLTFEEQLRQRLLEKVATIAAMPEVERGSIAGCLGEAHFNPGLAAIKLMSWM